MNVLLAGLGEVLLVLGASGEIGPAIDRGTDVPRTLPGRLHPRVPRSPEIRAHFRTQVLSESPRRAPLPDPSSIASAERRIREEFQEEYRLGTPFERAGFACLLFDVASKSPDRGASRWVLLREAITIASGAGDLATSLRAIDLLARTFDVDAAPLRTQVLSAAAKTAAAPEDYWTLAQGTLTMADEAIAAARLSAAETSAGTAAEYAEKAKSLALVTRAKSQRTWIAEHRSEMESARRALEILASRPADPEANLVAGQYEAFALGHWETGLRRLAQGSNPGIKDFAERDLSGPTDASDQVVLGDAWWTLAETQGAAAREPLRLRADAWYQKAAAKATSQDRTRIGRRHQELEEAATAAPGIDLLRLIDPERDNVQGEWEFEEGTLVCRREVRAARLQIPFLPPEEYDLAFVAERTGGCDAINVNLSQGKACFHMVVDGYAGTGYASGLALIDRKFANANETTRRGPLLVQGRPSTVECCVRKTTLWMKVDGKLIFEWSGDVGRLSTYDLLQIPQPRALALSGWMSQYRFSQVTLIPVSGRGEILR